MRLSIIIVNYNVKYFLEQALFSVNKACKNISAEIFVVDNHSVDGSVEMVKERFPEVILIENKKNTGFSYANNQAIKLARGEYILLLNPDTLVEEDTFEKILDFMDAHPDAGGLGVKMIDGSGRYLPESKRGLPSPAVAFCKIAGLSALFPKSKHFGRYHLGFLDKDMTHQVDILSGAFMLIRKVVIDKIGLLDETFFMYGEDIDLSYRILKGGYKNYYFPGARIIHYKGESTKKSSINYVFVFYNAMIIFAKKHFSQKNAKAFSFLIHIAIYIRAGLAIFNRFLKKIFLPVHDFLLILGGLFLIKSYWENTIKASEGIHYHPELVGIMIPGYVFVWLVSVFLNGGYDKPIKLSNIFKGIITGTILILTIYALLPESFRFSRAIILIGAVWAGSSIVTSRLILELFRIKEFALYKKNKKRIVIAGDKEEGNRVLSLLKLTNHTFYFLGFIRQTPDKKESDTQTIGTLEQLEEICNVYKIDEVIFCSKDISSQYIIDTMSRIASGSLEYKIAPPESLYIIGSNSVNGTGDLYILNINTITKQENKRNKRLTDIFVCLFLCITLPINIFFIKKTRMLLKNIFLVLLGKKSWVGYAAMPSEVAASINLPKIKSGVLSPANAFKKKLIPVPDVLNLNLLYAKDYKVYYDLNIIINGFKDLGT